MNKATIRESKFLSLVLRHKPETIGLALDANGWASLEDIVEKSKSAGIFFDLDKIRKIVATNDKKRFSLNEDGTKIRANQGHSVEVDMQYVPEEPPVELYHGTTDKAAGMIMEEGIKHGRRLYVHLSADTDTARDVARRREGEPVILKVLAKEMYLLGAEFYKTANGNWLTKFVPAKHVLVMR